MRISRSLASSLLLIATIISAGMAQGQGTATRMSPAAYGPDSPQTENRLFRVQSGHYGRFYNCDGEEAKRNSPYICWKNSHEPQLPARMGWRERIRHEAFQVVQRVVDGSCCYEGCEQGAECSDCQSQSTANSQSNPCGCSTCAASRLPKTQTNENMVTVIADNSVEPTTNAVEPKLVGRFGKSGLISVTPARTNSEAAPTVAAAATAGSQIAIDEKVQPRRSLLAQLRSKSPASKQRPVNADRPQIETGQESIASMSLLDRLKSSRQAETKPASVRQASANSVSPKFNR